MKACMQPVDESSQIQIVLEKPFERSFLCPVTCPRVYLLYHETLSVDAHKLLRVRAWGLKSGVRSADLAEFEKASDTLA